MSPLRLVFVFIELLHRLSCCEKNLRDNITEICHGFNCMYSIPRANLTFDYYNPNLQAGIIDTRTSFQKYIQNPMRSAY